MFIKLNKQFWLSLILLLVVLLAAAGYFRLKARYLKPVDSLVFFDSTVQLDQLFTAAGNQQNPVHVVYVWQSGCPCDATVLPHFYELMAQFADKNVSFELADITDKNSIDRPKISLLSPEKNALIKASVNMTPSVAIWDGSGELVYFGPHNLGIVCNADTSFIQKVLTHLFSGGSDANTSTIGEGCFCETSRYAAETK